MPAKRPHTLRFVYALLLTLTVLFTAYEELYLRRWLFRHLGRKSIAAGSLPNFLAVLILGLAVALLTLPATKREITRKIFAIVIGLVVYEAVQVWLPRQFFDWKGIAATCLAGAIVWLVIYLPARILVKVH